MRFLLLFATILSQILATNLLTYNLYDRSDRVDIMLSFDSPYSGQIFQKRDGDLINLKLNNLNYNKSVKRDIDSKFIQNLSIKPDKDSVQISINSKTTIGVIASKTTDGFGLRIRIKPLEAKGRENTSYSSKIAEKKLTYSDNSTLDSRYLSVIAILLFLLIVMFWIKRRYSNKSNMPIKNSWLFKGSQKEPSEIKIIYRKQIDNSNSAILLEFEDKKYLVMSGNSNILLDSFGENDLKDKGDFEKAFEDNRKKLDDYLKLQDRKLEDYKAKASGDFQQKFDFTS